MALTAVLLLAGPFVQRTWSASANQPPAVMHFCNANCFTLVFKDGKYLREDGSPETWTVERFTQDSVILHRHDAPAAWNGNKGDVKYAGRVSNDSLIGITVEGAPASNMTLAWGSALNSVPANNAERDRRTTPPASAAAAQSAAAVLASTPEPSNREAPLLTRLPLKLNVCDGEGGSQHCVLWSWNGSNYVEDAGTLTQTQIEVFQWNADAVILNESDSSSEASYTYTFTGHLQGDGSVRGEMQILPPGRRVLGRGRPISKSVWKADVMNTVAPSYPSCDVHDAAAVQVGDAMQRVQAAINGGDLVTGACWARIGAAQGGRWSQSVYGYSLSHGRGVGRDIKLAFFWTEKAAQQHDYAALLNVAEMYESGDGVERDHAKALAWLEEAQFQKKLAATARGGPDQLLESLVTGYLEQYTGMLDQEYQACTQDAAAGKPKSEQCIDVQRRYHAGQEAAAQKAYEDCRRKNPRHEVTECRRN